MDEEKHPQEYVRREKIDEVRHYLENIIAHTPGHIYWKDLNCRFLGCNDLQAKTVGLPSREAIVGLSALDIIAKNQPEEERIKQAEAIDNVDKQVMSTNQAITIEEPLTLDNGKQKVFLSQKVPLRNSENQVIGILGISIDITQQKEAEKQILIAKERAEAANKAKENFLENMRHDLRTPFTGILTLAKLMLNTETDSDKKENLECISDSATVLLNYMNEILENATIESSIITNQQQKIKLRNIIDHAIATVKPIAKTKKLTLNVSIPSSVPEILLTDKFKLQRILINLLGNAAKFTEAGSINVEVKILTESEHTIKLAIAVKDTGIGIATEKLEYIFERFTKVEQSSINSYQGIGLGLNDVKELCNQLKGEIDVKHNKPQGTIFTCTLPFGKTSESNTSLTEQTERQTTSNKTLPALNILLVEDQQIAAMAARKLLESYGHTVIVANTGQEAFEKFKTNGELDLVLMDIGLPDISGIEATKKILKFEQTHKKAHTLIIALTAHQNIDDKEMKGFDGVYSKPILPKTILDISDKHFQNS